MSRILAIALAAFLLPNLALADSSDANRVAIDGGFLLGNAHRCGVPTARVARVGEVIHRLIAATAKDSREASTAELRFAAIFLATADPNTKEHALIPPCRSVLSQFELLERHRLQAGVD